MKTFAGLLVLLLLASGCSPKPKDEVVVKFVELLNKYQEAGIRNWENGSWGVADVSSNNPEKVLAVISRGSMKYEATGPITCINEPLIGCLYGVQAIRTDTTHEGAAIPTRVILFMQVRLGHDNGPHWAWRQYELSKIPEIEKTVADGIAKRRKQAEEREAAAVSPQPTS